MTRTKRQPRPPNSSESPDLAHHSIKCGVCHHPARKAIEQDFLRWRSPEKLAADYGIADHSSIYRHVHATGLYAQRQLSVRRGLERIMERAEEYQRPSFDIVRAATAYSHLDDNGRWIKFIPQISVELAGDHIVIHESLAAATGLPDGKINRQPGNSENAANR